MTSYEIDYRMMSVEKEVSEATAASKEREKKIRELGKAVATKGTNLSVCRFVCLYVCPFICGKSCC
jgi:hypothetical protein